MVHVGRHQGLGVGSEGVPECIWRWHAHGKGRANLKSKEKIVRNHHLGNKDETKNVVLNKEEFFASSIHKATNNT